MRSTEEIIDELQPDTVPETKPQLLTLAKLALGRLNDQEYPQACTIIAEAEGKPHG